MPAKRERTRKRGGHRATRRARARRKQQAREQSRDAALRETLHAFSDGTVEFLDRFAGSGLESVVTEWAPKLTDRSFWPILDLAVQHRDRWVRNPKLWKPSGHAPNTQVRSLIAYLFVRFPVPQFLYGAFAGGCADFVELFIEIGQGASLPRLLRSEGFAHLPPLTNAMCHWFLHTKAGCPIPHAFRFAQVGCYGGNRELARAICATQPLGARVGKDEAFWQTVIQWMCRQRALAPARVGPLIDFIQFCREDDPNWSIKGRSARALLVAMEQWHADLHEAGDIATGPLPDSGLKPLLCAYHPGNEHTERWSLRQIASGWELLAEGKAQRSCVFWYLTDVLSGWCSIWSLRRNDKRVLTIQVCHDSMRVIEVCRKCNMLPTESEMHWVRLWAADNGLSLSRWVADYVLDD